MNSAINWFEIPTVDFDRAIAFYQAMLDIQLVQVPMGPTSIAVFPYVQGTGVGGHIQQPGGDDNVPSLKGPVIYLNADEKLDASLARVEGAGGEILMPKTSIGPQGFIAFVKDTEGNRIGLHAMTP